MGQYVRSKKSSKYITIAFSFLGAVMFWGFHVLHHDYKTQITVPVRYTYNYKDTLAIVEPPKEKITLEVKGRGWDLVKHYSTYGEETLDFEIQKPLRRQYLDKEALLERCKILLSGTEVIRVIGDSLIYDIQPIAKKRILLRVQKDSLKKTIRKWGNRYISRVSLDNKSIVLLGPKTAVDTVNAYLSLQIHSLDSHEIGNTSQQIFSLTNQFDSTWFKLEPKEVIATISFERVKRKVLKRIL